MLFQIELLVQQGAGACLLYQVIKGFAKRHRLVKRNTHLVIQQFVADLILSLQ